jgi:Asp-tRNA(Asn)/Glu-tRNA(Gln) amidotransferase A subunit family amidase
MSSTLFPQQIFAPGKRSRRSPLTLVLALGATLVFIHSIEQVVAAEKDLTTATLADLQAGLAAGTLSSEKLVQLYLQRIEAYDKQGPKVNCVITINPKALEQAKALDQERWAKGPRSSIHGIPVVLKDLIDVAGLPTTAGFTPFGAPVPKRDATIVSKIQEAGGIILAKVSTSNWFGNGFDETHPIGESLNPYNLDYSPGGSSNGSGVAIAASFAPLAVGTDTSVSVQSPASSTSSVGFVGTFGMVSRAGIVPRGATQDRPGPIAKTVADAAALFSVMAGWDPEDLTTHSALGHHPTNDWSALLRRGSLVGKRLGVLREMIPSGPEFAEGVGLFERAVEDLRAAGAHIVDPVLTGNPSLAFDTSQPRLRTAEYEKIAFTDAYMARLGPDRPWKTTREMMEKVGFTKFSRSMVTALELPSPTDSADYQARYRSRLAHIRIIKETKEKFDLDAFILPFSASPPPPAETGPKAIPRPPGGGMWSTPRPGVNSLSSSLGLPACVIPTGYTKDNLPIALQIMGAPYDDLEILRIAFLYEAASQRRVPAATTPPLPSEKFNR